MSTGVGEPLAAAQAEPRRRLNPLSPLLNSAKTIGALIAAISIQGFLQLGWPAGFGVVLVAITLTVAVSVVSWLVTGYHVVGRELRIYDGVLVRRTRAIPLERLQSVEVVRPLLARAVGLAELRLEVVGGGKTEAPLAFLTVAEAAALRERLLALAVRVGALTGPPDRPESDEAVQQPSDGEPAERALHRVVNREVLISQLLTPQVMFLPFGVALVATQSLFRTAWSVVVLLSMIFAVIGVVQQPVRRILSDWNFRLALRDPPPGERYPGLRLRHGLTETRSQTIPLNRVQAITVTWPLLWRRRRWLRCRLSVAGIRVSEESIGASDRLLPVGDLETAERLVGEVLPGVELTAVRLTPPPDRARWLAPVQGRLLGAGLAEQVLATREGRVTRHLVIVPYLRIQSVRVVQGPLQRLLGLATMRVDTAGTTPAVAYHRSVPEARWLAGEITERAAAARMAEAAGGVAPTT